MCRNASGEGRGDQFKCDVELLAFKQPVLVAIFAVPGTPFHRAFAEDDLFGGVSVKRQASNELVFQVRADGGFGSVEVTAGIFDFEGNSADLDAINLNGGAGRFAGDAELFGAHRTGEENEYE